MNSHRHSATHDWLSGEFATSASLTRLGVLAASIAHEVNQLLTGIITNASTCLRMLAADPPERSRRLKDTISSSIRPVPLDSQSSSFPSIATQTFYAEHFMFVGMRDRELHMLGIYCCAAGAVILR